MRRNQSPRDLAASRGASPRERRLGRGISQRSSRERLEDRGGLAFEELSLSTDLLRPAATAFREGFPRELQVSGAVRRQEGEQRRGLSAILLGAVGLVGAAFGGDEKLVEREARGNRHVDLRATRPRVLRSSRSAHRFRGPDRPACASRGPRAAGRHSGFRARSCRRRCPSAPGSRPPPGAGAAARRRAPRPPREAGYALLPRNQRITTRILRRVAALLR